MVVHLGRILLTFPVEILELILVEVAELEYLMSIISDKRTECIFLCVYEFGEIKGLHAKIIDSV